MFATSCTRPRITKGLTHSYDRISGWCLHGCGNREDGRITTREGNDIAQGPKYTDDELSQMRDNATRALAERTYR